MRIGHYSSRVMKAVARAAVDVQGRQLQYAEIEEYGGRRRLLRLGSCDFDFNVVDELVGSPDSDKLLSVRGALRDVFAGSVASELRFVLRPPVVRTFFSAVPSDLPRSSLQVRARQEAALLYGTGPDLMVDLNLTAEAYDESHFEERWLGVSVTLEDVRKKLGRLAGALPGSSFQVCSSRVAAGKAVQRFQQVREEEEDGIVMAVGCFEGHYELAFAKDRQWLFSHGVLGMTEADAAFFAANILRRFGYDPVSVGRVLVYGESNRKDLPTFELAFGVTPSAFDPLMLVNIDPATLDEDYNGGAFLPCVGAAV